LSYVTVLGGTGFSTLSGSSMGSTALMGSLMVPEMGRRGYKKHMSIGPILGTGGLAIIIPPSALAVLLATLAQIDVGALLIAGVIPGLILACFYVATIYLQTRLDPEAAPPYDVPPISGGEKVMLLLRDVVPMVGLMVVIVIMMINGIVTPSEAAAFGALGVLILAALYRCLSWEAIRKSVRGALRVTLMAYLIVFGSATFSQLLAFSGASRGLITWATGFDLDPIAMLLVMFGVSADPRHVHGADLDHAADGADLLPAGDATGVRPDLVRPHHAAGAGDQLHHAALRVAALRDEGGRAAGHDDARDLPRGVPLHPVFAPARRAPDRVSDPRDLVAEPRLRPVGYSSRKARLKYTVSGCVR
jgi:hypothetical protein